MEQIATYRNGNTCVTILQDGTKIREYEDSPEIIHPESIDIKITDYCDMGCAYCHESSTTAGKHADLSELLRVISDLPAGVELAIGGGNPLSHPDLKKFLLDLKRRGIIANITVNQGHLKSYYELIRELISDGLIHGLGISITSNNFTYVKKINELSSNVVFHVIAGVNDISIIDRLMEFCEPKILILGYKTFGFGIQYYSPEVELGINSWKRGLRRYVGKVSLSFDNLAIEQLSVRRLFTHEGWEKFYMGDDFCFTMYIDAVKQEYGPTSRSNDRVSFDKSSLLEYFKNNNLNKVI
jgi:hypothetical protein